MAEPLKIAVLGGGMGALAAAWELAHQPPAARPLEITVYQRGWRLGGKGASGRNPRRGQRIEEHGIHILMGFYDHALRVLRDCYAEVHARRKGGAPGILAWERALTGWDDIFMAEPRPGARWDVWHVVFPRNARRPGIDSGPPVVVELVWRAIDWVFDLEARLRGSTPLAIFAAPWNLAAKALRDAFQALTAERALGAVVFEPLAEVLENLLRAAWLVVRPLVDDRTTIRRLWIALNFATTNVIGLIREGLVHPPHDFEKLDHVDYKAWLRRHAATACPPSLAEDAPPVNAIYDLVFSRSHGFAAGTCLHDTLLMLLNYKGHVYYRMNAGMGDVVFTPLYLALRARGVRFRFFHRVTGVHVDAAGRAVEAIAIERQIASLGDYDPLVDVHGLLCWPSEPKAGLLPADHRAAHAAYDFERDPSPSPFGAPDRLVRGRDFDAVVLGIGLGALAGLCDELARANPAFTRMTERVRTTRTQAMQLWFTVTARELGWTAPPAMLGSYERPFNSCADMSQVAAHEDWPRGGPRTIAYLCDALEDDVSDAEASARVRERAVAWIGAHARRLWPHFDWSALHDPDGRVGVDRFRSQYWRANVEGSERYVLSVPGSTGFRLAPDASGFTNLFLAGDWVRTDLNAGCLEAATMGGLAAGRALARWAAGAPADASPPSAAPRVGPACVYVDRDGDWVLRHPVRLESTVMHGFVLPADGATLAQLCARYVDGPSGGRVRAAPLLPFFPCVVLVTADIGRVRSGDPRDGAKGYLVERDVAFFVPVRLDAADGARPACLVPYVFVDNAAGMVAGREIFGFWKDLARIRTTTDPPAVDVVAQVLPAYAPSQPTRRRRVLSVAPSGPALGVVLPGGAVEVTAALVRAALAAVAGAPADLAAAPGRDGFVDVPLVFLKQFRDVAVPAAACHQSLVEAVATIDRIASAAIVGADFDVRLRPAASLDIGRTLGLGPRPRTLLAFRADVEFTIPLGRVLWQAA
jgi:uncharacterized protein with NAD-binding domain and iron-sulfur cluster